MANSAMYRSLIPCYYFFANRHNYMPGDDQIYNIHIPTLKKTTSVPRGGVSD